MREGKLRIHLKNGVQFFARAFLIASVMQLESGVRSKRNRQWIHFQSLLKLFSRLRKLAACSQNVSQPIVSERVICIELRRAPQLLLGSSEVPIEVELNVA